MFEGYQRYAARRVPLKQVRYVRRTRPSTFRGRPVGPRARRGYGSVARARGAAVEGEMKYFDCDASAIAIAAVTTTWVAGTMVDPGQTINLGSAAVATPQCLCAPIVAATLNGRIGRKIKMLKCRVNGIINIPPQTANTVADTATKIRVALVMDKQTNAAQMTGAALFNDGTAAATTINSMQNPNFFGRFKVLKEKTITIGDLNVTGSPTAGDVIQTGRVIPFKMSYRFKVPVEVNFNATNGGTVGDIINNSLHMVCGASNISFAPTISYYSRVAYKE